MSDDYTKEPKFLPNSEGPLWVVSGIMHCSIADDRFQAEAV
jgi:hypothetical protein